jgi:molecular chaperone GrpE
MFNQTTNPASHTTDPDATPPSPIEETGAPSATDTAAQAETSTETENWQGKYQLLQDQFTRLAADFDNYRKRIREEQTSLVKYGSQKTVTELLPVLDNLERASASLSEDSDPKVLFKSFGLVRKQLMDALEGLGVKKIQTLAQPFDPQYHEAVNQTASNDFPENTVAFEAQSGYTLHDKVIRPAMVIVSTGPSDAAAENAASANASAHADQPAEAGAADDQENRGNPFLK